jgi:hypothetical protein
MSLLDKVPPPSSPLYNTSMTEEQLNERRLRDVLDLAISAQARDAESHTRRVIDATLALTLAAVKSRR